jgi:hypothetical protein
MSDSIRSAMEAGGAVSNGVGGDLNTATSSSPSPLLLSRSKSESGEASRNYGRSRESIKSILFYYRIDCEVLTAYEQHLFDDIVCLNSQT